jgi:hypothetical protein
MAYRGEAFARHEHGANWLLERWVVRERGVVPFGPDPRSLIDPILPNALLAAVRLRLREWDASVDASDARDWLRGSGQQTYVVETMCRALCTLAIGELPSRPRAVAWARSALPEPRRSTVERSRPRCADGTRATPPLCPR